MKKLLLGVSLIALLAGCASHQDQNGMGGSDEDYNRTKTDEYNTNNNSQFNNNATEGTGSSTAPNYNNGTSQ